MTIPVSNTYTGDGTTVLFPFTFEYIETADVYVRIDNETQESTTWSFANATTVQMNVAPAFNSSVVIYRRTSTDEMPATFFNGSTIQAPDLNDNFNVVLFVAQESQAAGTGAADDAFEALVLARQADEKSELAFTASNTAAIAATEAVTASEEAIAAGAAATTSAEGATSAALTAEATAAQSLAVANNAESIATGIESTANTADTNATTALNTANTAAADSLEALSTANDAETKAELALAEAEDAVAQIKTAVEVSEVAPESPVQGSLWWADTTQDEGGGRLYTYTGSEWVDVSVPGTFDDEAQPFLSNVNDDAAAGNITFEKDVRVEGTFTSSRASQTDAVQVVPTVGSSQSSTLQITRAVSTNGNLTAVEVLKGGNTTAEISFNGQGIFSDVKLTAVTNSVGLGTDASGNIIDSGATLDARYLSATQDDTATGLITLAGGAAVESGSATVLKVERTTSGNTAVEYVNSTGNSCYAGGTTNGDFAVHSSAALNDSGAYLTVSRASGKVNIGGAVATSGIANSLMIKGRLGCDGINPYSSGTANVNINSSGVFSIASSSARYKTDIETMDDSYADKVINECRPVYYRANPETTDPENPTNPTYSFWGFIAEEVEQVDPRLCFYSEDEEGNSRVEGVAYDSFAPILLNVIKRQKEQLEELDARFTAQIDGLRGEIEALKPSTTLTDTN